MTLYILYICSGNSWMTATTRHKKTVCIFFFLKFKCLTTLFSFCRSFFSSNCSIIFFGGKRVAVHRWRWWWFFKIYLLFFCSFFFLKGAGELRRGFWSNYVYTEMCVLCECFVCVYPKNVISMAVHYSFFTLGEWERVCRQGEGPKLNEQIGFL